MIFDNWLKGAAARSGSANPTSSSRTPSATGRHSDRNASSSRRSRGSARGTPIRLEQGILFATYATLRSDAREEKVSRVQQIVEWLGSDFDGVIVFDESHAMANAAGIKGQRGDQAPSQQGRAGLHLQHALPDARVVYVSATGATTVHNLADTCSGSGCGAARISRSRRAPSSCRRSKPAASLRWKCWRAISNRSASMRRGRSPMKASNTSSSSTS